MTGPSNYSSRGSPDMEKWVRIMEMRDAKPPLSWKVIAEKEGYKNARSAMHCYLRWGISKLMDSGYNPKTGFITGKHISMGEE